MQPEACHDPVAGIFVIKIVSVLLGKIRVGSAIIPVAESKNEMIAEPPGKTTARLVGKLVAAVIDKGLPQD